ncbi:bolA-like protein 1 [[Candida] jaroonii]|uniref:BolA-like protein 1 n=1 Tax=[Candida] jaroonii TaxID=467808 RepID=A0ACA9Y7W1_9ASCO|nr:bolA-like protein 1 [[Candida] jaroonii]
MKVINSSVNGPMEKVIVDKLTALKPTSITVHNDSHKHSHHKGMENAENKVESHFRIEIISDEFKGLNMPSRHRSVFKLLDHEFKTGLHSLVLKTKTPEEK